MDIGTQMSVITLALGALGMILVLFLAIMGPEIGRWFRVMARRDLPDWGDRLRHLETHQFGWNGICQTCRQAGMRDAEMAFAGGQTESQLWGNGYEAGYSDGQGNRPRREG